MIDVGLGQPGAREYLDAQLEVVDHLGTLQEQIARLDPAPPTSELVRLTEAFPAAPINFALSTSAALAAARGALDQISPIMKGQLASSRIVLQALLRVALVGAGRVVFTLGPDDPEERLQNVKIVLAQESRSMAQALEAFVEFGSHGLKPDEAYVAEHRRLDRRIREGTPRRGDGSVLLSMADVIGRALVTEGQLDVGDDPRLLAEQVTWTWHTYSGLAHGFAWPWLLPGTTADRAMPGDYVADLGIVVATAHIAFRKTLERLSA
jgi:hypothetical protein